MTLKLVMIRCPDSVAPQRREIRGGELSIGRGQDNDWIIPDPERHLSKRHCRLTYAGGEWELHDLSTNGTFVNQGSEPVGRGTAQKLRNGDRIKFGLYEIEVTVDDEGAGAAFEGGGAPTGERSEVAMRDSDLRSYDDARLPGTGSMLDESNAPILPADFDPLAANQEPFRGPTQPDHAHALESAFRPPSAPAAIIPDDWDVDLPGTSGPRAAQSSEPSPPHEPALPPRPRQEPVPGPRAGLDPGLAAAFLRGVGLKDATLTDPEKTLEKIGAAMRVTVNGLRQTLMARASVKDVFRIEQTMIRASGNNPLKFSLDDDDALATLLGTGRRGGMAPEEAIAEAFDDLRMHELATVSAMQEAVRVLLAQFEPDSVERKAASNALQIHPAQGKARAWDAFVQLHKTVTQALSDDFDSVFGKAFARAYEQAIDKLGGDRKAS